LSGRGVAVFHAHDTTVPFVVDVLEDILIVDLARSRFFSSGVVPYLKVGDLIPAKIDVGNEVTFVALHMVDVVENFAGRRIDRLAYHITLVRMAKEEIRR